MADIRALQADFLREARIKFGSANYAAQLTWIKELYIESASDRSGAEITSQAFEGVSHSAQFRGATPDERRQALGLAFDHLETLTGATRTLPASGLKIDFSTRTTST